MTSAAQFTVICTIPVDTWLSFEASAIPVLLIVPHVAEVVGEVMCTEALAPDARLNPLPPHVSTPALMPQVQPPVVDATVQFRPGLSRNVSFKTTSHALPGPLFVTASMSPTWSPADTDPLSAVFSMPRLGNNTSVVQSAVSLSVLSDWAAVAVAVTTLVIGSGWLLRVYGNEWVSEAPPESESANDPDRSPRIESLTWMLLRVS